MLALAWLATHDFWVTGASPWAADALESASLRLRLEVTLPGVLLNGILLVDLMVLRLLPWSQTLMVVFVLDHVTGVSSAGAGSVG